MPKKRAPFYFDTVTLSNFALAGRMDILVKRYGRKLCITSEVSNEIAAGIVAGYKALALVEHLLQRKMFTLTAGPQTKAERSLFLRLLRNLSPGEASAIAAAKIHGGVVVTDDRAARTMCDEHKISVTGTIGILMASCTDVVITAEEADNILDAMVAHGYRSPVKRISDLL